MIVTGRLSLVHIQPFHDLGRVTVTGQGPAFLGHLPVKSKYQPSPYLALLTDGDEKYCRRLRAADKAVGESSPAKRPFVAHARRSQCGVHLISNAIFPKQDMPCLLSSLSIRFLTALFLHHINTRPNYLHMV